MAERYVIVNADDFGMSAGVNRGIAAAHERGIVTSASLMVRCAAAAEAAAYARNHPTMSLGLHLDLGEWVYRDGAWEARYEVISQDDATQVAAETRRQLAAFRSFVGKDPTHLDSHQHVHEGEPRRSVITGIAAELGIPVRNCTRRVRYCGRFYGYDAEGAQIPGGITVERLVEILSSLRPGVTELICHPGYSDGADPNDPLVRDAEVEVLCSPDVRTALDRLAIRLCSFRDLAQGNFGESA